MIIRDVSLGSKVIIPKTYYSIYPLTVIGREYNGSGAVYNVCLGTNDMSTLYDDRRYYDYKRLINDVFIDNPNQYKYWIWLSGLTNCCLYSPFPNQKCQSCQCCLEHTDSITSLCDFCRVSSEL
jgi:hypothetical protein